MNMGQPSYSDPLIDEVRQRRRDLFAEHGNDLDRLLEAIGRCQEEHPEKLVDLRSRTADSAETT
jgi:hypothetical protein